jgi:hypothetical protein
MPVSDIMMAVALHSERRMFGADLCEAFMLRPPEMIGVPPTLHPLRWSETTPR